jgi:hypothetical protein
LGGDLFRRMLVFAEIRCVLTLRDKVEAMRRSPDSNPSVFSAPSRRFLLGAAATAFANARGRALAFAPANDHAGGPLKIEAVELVSTCSSIPQKSSRKPYSNPNSHKTTSHAPARPRPAIRFRCTRCCRSGENGQQRNRSFCCPDSRPVQLRLRRRATSTWATAALHPPLLHAFLICFKLLLLVIVQNGFNLCFRVGANALHLGHAIFTR